MKLKEFAHINPRTSLDKNTIYPFVEMAEVTAGRRYVFSQQNKEFKGSCTKFQNRDTLLARITPCLQNGKIAQYISSGDQHAFGSTEFIVFRAKENISDSAYLYYLVSSSVITEPSIKSMSGATGRQRVNIEAVQDIEFDAISLGAQQKIAAILSAYDDLIENNNKRIKILDEMAQRLYKHWFIDFKFPNHENTKFIKSELGLIPEGWVVKELGDCLELLYGKALKKENRVHGNYPVYGSSGVVGYHNEALVLNGGLIVGRKGNVGSVFRSDVGFHPIDTVYYVNSELPDNYLYYSLQRMNFLNNDAAVPGLNRKQAYSLNLIVPDNDELEEYEGISEANYEFQRTLEKRNENLSKTRDLLLLRLISGELSIEDMEIAV